MQEKPKEDAEVCEDEPEPADAGDNCSVDQGRGSYYYDDAHGYEKYDPGDDEESTKEGNREDPR